MTTKTITFKVEGEFITRLAREQCHYEGRFNYAMELLESSMQSEQLNNTEIKAMAFAILDGRAKLKGVYPDGDYGFEYLETREEEWNLGNLIEKAVNEKKKAKEEIEEIKCKMMFVEESLSAGEKRTISRNYKEEFGEYLWENDTAEEYSYKDSLLDNFLKRMHCETENDYGWLEPDGTFHAVEWSKHQEWACEYMDQHMSEEDWLNDTTDWAGDYLTDRGWILLHNPAQGIAMITKNPSKEMTKAQKEFLYGYYIDRNCTKEANAIWNEGE